MERMWADDNVAFATSLHMLDPSWRSETFPLAGGHAVLCGVGLFVNVALSCGVTVDLQPNDLERLELRCSAVGVTPAIELTVASTTVSRQVVIERGYRLTAKTSALSRAMDDDVVPDDSIEIRTVAGQDDRSVWQQAAAEGWGHDTGTRRRASDAFAAAAFATDGQTLFVGLDHCAGQRVGTQPDAAGLCALARQGDVRTRTLRFRSPLCEPAG